MGIGILTQQLLVIRKLASEAEEALKEWSKTVLDGLKPEPGPYAFFSHNAHALERVRDMHRVLERLYEERIRLRVLDEQEYAIMPRDWPGGVPFPPEIQEIMKENHKLNEHVKMDFESLYMFANILLDQWSLCVAYAAGLPHPEKFNFLGIVQTLEEPEYNGTLKALWGQSAGEMLWLNGQIRFYRNRFVVHADRPWQRGNTRSTFGYEYALFIPSPPGWLNDEEITVQIRELLPLAPQWLREARDDYWEKANPRALLTRLLDHIGEIEDRGDRETVLRLVGQYGTTTPTFQVIGERVLRFVKDGSNIVSKITMEHLDQVNLGNPKK